MLSASKAAEIIEALLESGNVGVAQKFFKSCGPNWEGAFYMLADDSKLVLRSQTMHDTKTNPRVMVTVFNALAAAGRDDMIGILYHARIGNMGKIKRWCTSDANAAIRSFHEQACKA